MNDIDQKIRAALSRDSAGNELPGEPNLAEEVVNTFRGRHRWLSSLMVVVNFAALGGLVFAIMRFMDATEVTIQLRWAGLAAVLLLVASMIKIWFWLELHCNRVLREVKRVELLLATRPQ